MDTTKTAAQPEARLHFLDYWRIIRIRKVVIIAVFLLVVLTATVVTLVLPKAYGSSARILIERDQSDIAEIQGPQMPLGYDPYFIQTQLEVMKSEVVLGKVIEELQLNKVWGDEYFAGQLLKTTESMRILKGKMDLRPERNTSLIEIRVVDGKPEAAAALANSIAIAYQNHRLVERQSKTKGGIDSLRDTLAEHDKKVQEAQAKVDTLRDQLKISDAMVGSDIASPLITGDTLRKLEGLRIESQAEYVRQNTLLEQLKGLSQGELIQVLPSAAQDTLLGSFLEQLNIAQQRLLALQKEYGPEHSEVQKVAAQVADLEEKVRKRADGIVIAINARVLSLKSHLDTLQREVDNATRVDIEKAASSRPYFEAKSKLEELKRFRLALSTKIELEQADMKLPKGSVVQIVDRAVPIERAVRPNMTLNIILGVIIGLVVGIGLAFFIEYLDTSVKTIDDVERSLGSPVLGVIPQNVGILLREGAESPHAEAYRVLRTNLLFSRKDDKLNTLAVVSAGAGEGKSTTVFNLATVFAQSGNRVVIVDSDLRRPTLHKILKVTNSLGLTNYLLKQNTLEEVIQHTNLPSLDFMASGKLPSSSLGILSSSQMKDLIRELKQHYDYVFFDSPPVMGVSDASILASEVDMTLQVIQYRRYPQPMNIRAKQMIEKVGGNLVGIVLNNINMSQDESYYYYSGYYNEYYSKNEDQEPTGKRPSPEEARS